MNGNRYSPHRNVSRTLWEAATPLRIDEFSWHYGEPTPRTTGRALYDDQAIDLQFHVENRGITADVAKRNGPILTVRSSSSPIPTRTVTRGTSLEGDLLSQSKPAWKERNWEEYGIGHDLVSVATAEKLAVETSGHGPSTRMVARGRAPVRVPVPSRERLGAVHAGSHHHRRGRAAGCAGDHSRDYFPIDLNRWLTLAVQTALVGLAAGDIVSQDMLRSMADDPIIFAMANPTPEIGYEEIKKAREDTVIMATGRSDSLN